MDNARLGVVVSHPIQYHSPLFRYLARRIDVEVFYGFRPTAEQVGAAGFGVPVDWGIDLLDGYAYRFLDNVALEPTTERFSGIDTPAIGSALSAAGITHVMIMGWQLKSYWQAFLACLQRGISVSVRGDSQINPDESPVRTLLRKLVYPRFLNRYHRIFYVGARNRAYLLRYGASPDQLLFSPHAVDQEFWRPPLARPAGAQRPLRFLWVAKFIPKKRPHDAITAFRRVLEIDPNLELTMVGTGELLERCKALAADEPRVRFLGFRNQAELRDIYAAADCLLLTSDAGETWGLVVNEAMAMGLPAIVSNLCGCSEDLIEDDRTGFSYPMGDVDALTERMTGTARLLRADHGRFERAIAAKNATHSFGTSLDAIQSFLAA